MGWWDQKLQIPPGQRQAYAPPSPQYQPQQGYQQPAQQQPPPAPAEDPAQYEPPTPGDPHGYHTGTAKKMWAWKGNPQGGARETEVTGNCPSCGSPRFFSRSGAGVTTRNGVVQPSPECFECGYPRQQGDYGAPSAVASAGAARQKEAPPPPGSLASLRSLS